MDKFVSGFGSLDDREIARSSGGFNYFRQIGFDLLKITHFFENIVNLSVFDFFVNVFFSFNNDFIEFLASKSKRSTALDRLLAIAPALEAVGAESINEDHISAEVEAARQERRITQAAKSYHAYRP